MTIRRTVQLFALLSLLILPQSHAAVASDTTNDLARIEERLSDHPIVRADFTQERKMRVLKRPLLTTGKLTVSVNQGVLWQALTPQKATVLMTSNGISEWDSEGNPKSQEFSNNPTFQVLADTLLGVFSGDLRPLNDLFATEPNLGEGEWQLSLIPKAAPLLSFIEAIEVAGDQFVREAVIAEQSGDFTTIEFDNYQTQPATLTSEEARYFDQ